MGAMFKNAQSIVNMLKRAGGYFNHLEKVNMIKAENGNIQAELKIEEEHLNQLGTMHGGLAATIIDTYSCCALLTHEKCNGKFGSTVDLYVKYYKSAKLGDTILINAVTEKMGKSLVHMNCDIKDKRTGDLLYKGTLMAFLIGGDRAKL